MKAGASATDEEYFVVLLWDEAVVDIGVGKVSMMEGGVRNLSDFWEVAVVLLDFELLEVGGFVFGQHYYLNLNQIDMFGWL
jgi:hypothetical protein